MPPGPLYAPKPLPKNSWLAVVFSFLFPGLGQVYNGEIAKALVFFASFVGSITLVVHDHPFPFAFFIPFIFFFRLIDSFKSATAVNNRFLGGAVPEEKPSESPASRSWMAGVDSRALYSSSDAIPAMASRFASRAWRRIR